MSAGRQADHLACTRRDALGALAAFTGGHVLNVRVEGAVQPAVKLATFEADVTIPLGHPCMGGGIAPARRVVDPLWARGMVLIPEGESPIVIVAVDWCEIRNDAYDRWREVLAKAAGTDPVRVSVACVHQHDAPVADLAAERLLREQNAVGRICDLEFHDRAVASVAQALSKGLTNGARRVTHFGTGRGKVDRVASNRRYIGPDGKPAFDRTSACRSVFAREQPEGTIDPWIRTLSFWDEDRPLAALSVYATHPMSYYGKGEVSADFVGLARQRRQRDDPSVFQIYLSGCSGNVTAGKFNDGAAENRTVLADRIYQGMTQAWAATRRQPVKTCSFRSVAIRLEPRNESGFSVGDLTQRMRSDPGPFGQCLAAMGLSWRQRADKGRLIELPVLDLGAAHFLLLPGESYVEFQLLAQKLRPDSFVVVAGYGECATGYVPTEQAVSEGDTNLHDWCWVAPGAERVLHDALAKALNH
jgi:hypothetical protein